MGRLAYLQVFQGDTFRKMAEQQQARHSLLLPSRRPIVDNQGTLLAMDRGVYTLYGHPALFRQPLGVITETLSPLLNVPTPELLERLKAQETGIRIVDGLPEETAKRIQQLRLDGLELIPAQQRFYPQNDLFAQVVGFVNLEGQPQTGLEFYLKDRLQLPIPQVPQVTGPALPVVNLPNNDNLRLQLTLDHRLQQVAQDALQETVTQFGAKRGAVMVMDVHTGALRAFAVNPTFDPNQYFQADLAALKNWAITDLYEPGSTFKPINIAIALEAGVITPKDYVYDEGRIQADEWVIQNADYATGRVGSLSISEVLQYSSNVGMVHIMDKLPAADYYAWLQKLELDKSTGIELPAENSAPLKDRNQFVNSWVDAATTAFGQGIVLTPVKLLQLEAAIANGGKLIKPYVLEGLVNDAGTLEWQPSVPDPKAVFSPETTASVLSMMEDVVAEGTGKMAQIPGYRIGGKTGTAQKVTEWGGYGSGRITSFVGILPIEAPRFVVLAVIDEPIGDDAYGSTVAAPLVKTVMESLVVLEGIPPSSPQALGNTLAP
jgi:cell division protein FtsI (penicillin-binding protein 3)